MTVNSLAASYLSSILSFGFQDSSNSMVKYDLDQMKPRNCDSLSL